MTSPLRYSCLIARSAGIPGLLVWAFVGNLTLGLEGTAYAQEGGSDANPGQIQRRIEESAPPQRDAQESGPELPEIPESVGDDDTSFILAAVSLLGVETLTPADIAPAYEDLLATRITLADAAEIANRITEIYREKGYVLSRAFVPPQTIETGVLIVQVAEGHVTEVEFSGTDDLRTNLDPYVAPVLAENPLKLETLERTILLINDISGIQVARSNMREPEEGSGKFILSLEIDYDAQDGTVYLDNRGTPSVGRLQGWISGGLNSALGLGERLQVGVFTIPAQIEELLYKEVSYLQPLWSNGTEAFLSFAHSTIDAGSNLGQLDTNSESISATFRLSHPILRSRKESLWLNGFLEYRNALEYRQGVENFDDRIRVARLRVNYNRGGETFFVSSILRLSQGLKILNASNEREAPLSRFDANPNFTKISGETTYTQTLFGPVSAQVSVSGQKSANSLYSSEEFAVGGSRFGRAYDFAEITGEDGAAGNLELRFTFDERPPGVEFLQLYTFYDAGVVWNRNADGPFRRHSLSSAGVGMRANLPYGIGTSLEVAQPLTRQVFTSGNDTGARYFFTLSANF